MQIFEENDFSNCYGCQKCMYICSENAISMEKSSDGFLYPVVDDKKCIHCYKCRKECAMNGVAELEMPQSAYIALSKDNEILRKSSSGGVFYSVAKHMILDFGGIVCGAILDDNNNVVHKCTSSVLELKKMQGSKYVQSSLNVYDEVAEYLKQGKKVLFSGTPCQCHAIKEYCKTNSENLICIDIVCHGVGSQAMWQRQAEEIAARYSGDKITSFRYKPKAERMAYGITYLVNGKEKVINSKKCGYFSLYLDGRNLRESCYNCRYSTKNRVGDLTLGDCATWKEYYDFHPETAVSLVLVNSEKGRYIFDVSSDDFEYRAINYDLENNENKALHASEAKEKRFSIEKLRALSEGKERLEDYIEKETIRDVFIKIIRTIINAEMRSRIRKLWKKIERM